MSAQQDGGGSSESLSIEETNKLRAKLGLKPLEVEDSSGKESTSERKDVHRPAKNILDEAHTKKIKAKMERVRMMRETHKTLSSVKTLGSRDDEDDDITSWLTKSRKLDKERLKAERRQRELDAMDEDFGVSAMLDEEMSQKDKKRKGKGNESYSSKHLGGLKVEHDEGAFMDGTTTVLTLKDQDVLEDGDDILVNVNLLDLERAKKNQENKKRKPEYRPWEEEELDEDGMPINKAVLSKYDEEIEGKEKKSFTLNTSGAADLSDKMMMDMIKKDMQARAQTLDYSKGELAREYYTSEEMTAFKKPKKKRKMMKKKMLKADDLLRIDPDESEAPPQPPKDRRSSRREAPPSIKKEPVRETAEELKLSDEEDDDSELRIALARTRRLRQMERRRSPSPVQDAQVKMEDSSDEEEKSVSFAGAIISTTSEFCRTVGAEDASPTHRPSHSVSMEESDDDNDDMDIEEPEEGAPGTAGWSQVDPRQKKKDKIEVKLEHVDILEAEPIVSSSLAATLQMADQKGFLEQQKSKDELRKGVSLQLVGSAAEMDAKARDRAGELRDRERERERRERDREHDRDRHYDRDRERNPLEKPGYKPKVKLEYSDNSGRLLDEKEAFRQLSWRFHGKTSGKAKTEKRRKKLDEEKKMLKMSSTDTPLATRALLEDKLKETSSPFLVLSGSAQRSLTANTITKT
ncbi:U4/U6.U5 tri-snRNP-associated protein 1-like [Sycon ciliatum]|uniref:U4/U6.U5 tri-snRNP-associated protein 1-like n=1 Tax=Sycon ciliatum TaxID=27933 RepID=UPI0031F68D54